MKQCLKKIICYSSVILYCNVMAMQECEKDPLVSILQMLLAAKRGFNIKEVIAAESLINLSCSKPSDQACNNLSDKAICKCDITQKRRFFHCALAHDYCMRCKNQFLDRKTTRQHIKSKHAEQRHLIRLLCATRKV